MRWMKELNSTEKNSVILSMQSYEVVLVALLVSRETKILI